MKILALEKQRLGVTSADCAPYLEHEARLIWEMIQQGVIREIYFRHDRSEAVIVLEAPDVGAAHAILTRLPLVRNNLIEFEVIGLRPYPGLSRLFRQ